MKRKLKSIVAILTLTTFAFSGCGNKSEPSEENISSSTKKSYDIFVYNADPDIGTDFRAMCDEYTNRTGVIIRTVTPSEEKNNVENLKSYLNSDHPPDIFTVNNLYELQDYKSESLVWDFSNATEDSFKTVANNIPDCLKLSSNTTDNFGIPYSTEAYGFVVDPKMISSLFGGEKHRNVQSDLQKCSYEEFSNMVDALNSYISNNQIYTFTLNGKEYSLSPSKGDLSQKLTGIFSFAGGNKKNSGTYLANIALASTFKNPAEANIADSEKIDDLFNPMYKFAQVLDLITSNVSGANNAISRGIELISNTQNSTSQSIKNFINGKSVFLLASTQDYTTLSTFNSLVAKRCIFIPIKIPMSEQEITSSQNIAKNMHSSIPIYSPKYYCINAKSSDKEKKAAQDFLTWVQTSELAKKYTVSKFGFTPYDINSSESIDNPLSRSMLEYIKEDHILPCAYLGAPESWCEENLGKHLIDEYLSKMTWGQSDYTAIANYAVDKWKELANN
ncbi:MAG: extracellular solute-binding protein [Acutalibacteraceae bacterium]